MRGGGEAPGRRMMEVEEHRRLSYHIRAFLMPVLTLNLHISGRLLYPKKNFSRSSYLFDDVECMGRNSQNGSPSRKRGRSCLGAIFNLFSFFHQNQRYLLGEAMGKHCRIVIAIHLKGRTIKKIIHKKLAQDKFEGAGNGFTSIPVSQW